MKKLFTFLTIISIFAVGMMGCKTVPSVDTMYNFSYSVGKAGAYACELGGMNETNKLVVLYVVNTVAAFVPSTNSTFAATWLKQADIIIDELIKEGKIEEGLRVPINAGVLAAGSAVDFVLVKYPKAKVDVELVEACVHGTVDGFNSVIKPTKFASVYGTPLCDPKMNKEAYGYIRKVLKK